MLHLQTLGGLELTRSDNGASLVVPLQAKRLMLLAYLAASPRHGLRRRDAIIALFWPELDHEHARGCLRQALHTLRKNVGEGAIVTRGQDQVGLDVAALCWDANELQAALAAVCWKVAKPCAAFQARFGRMIRKPALTAARIAAGVHAVRAERDRMR